MDRWLLALAVVNLILAPLLKADQLLLADYKLNGNGVDDVAKSPEMTLTGVSFTNGALAIPNNELFDASARINGFAYNSFTVALDFNPLRLSESNSCILTGGPSYRWIVIEGDDFGNGHLQIRLNNGNPLFVFTNIVEIGRWHTLCCSVNVATQRIITFLDAQRLADIELQNFQFDVIGTAYEQADKVFLFRNFGNGSHFYGLADNLRVYARALTADEIISRYSIRLSIQHSSDFVLLYWPIELTGYVLESAASPYAAGPWTTDPRQPLPIGNQNVLLEQRAAGSRFFRLRKL